MTNGVRYLSSNDKLDSRTTENMGSNNPTDSDEGGNPNKRRLNIRKIRLVHVLLFILFMEVFVFGIILPLFKKKPELITYDKLVNYIQSDSVSKLDISEDEVSIVLNDGKEAKAEIPSKDSFMEFIQRKIENGAEIEINAVKSDVGAADTIFNLISLLLPVLWIVFLFKMLKRSSKTLESSLGGVLGDNIKIEPVTSKVTFEDVAGLDEEKEQFEEIVDFLKNPYVYQLMGARPPKGIIVNGEPGTGKTLLAKAIAGEANVPFFYESGSNFDNKFVGVGADKVRKLFEIAKKSAPCIIFIDEIDSIARDRYSGQSYSEQTLNQLLAEIDGFTSVDNVIVIASTNHLEVLDSAITRRGRFDRHIYIPMPDIVAREKILRVHARNKVFSEDVILSEIAKRTIGFCGADLECVLNEAAILAVNREKGYISMSEIDEAIARVRIGIQKKSKKIVESDKKLTAVHEAGHAIVSAIVKPETANLGISIVPRGKAGGYNLFESSDSEYLRKSDIEKEIQVCYGGRAAEEVIFNDVSSGASNDLEVASKLVLQMVGRYAMAGSYMVKVSGEISYNKNIDTSAMEKAEKICSELYESTKKIIDSNKQILMKLSSILCEKEQLSADEVQSFFKENLNI